LVACMFWGGSPQVVPQLSARLCQFRPTMTDVPDQLPQSDLHWMIVS